MTGLVLRSEDHARALRSGFRARLIRRTQKTRAYWLIAPAHRPPLAGLDLSGMTKGRLSVLGVLVEDRPESRKARWVVRCACGGHEVRSARALRDPWTLDDACFVCRTAERRAGAPS